MRPAAGRRAVLAAACIALAAGGAGAQLVPLRLLFHQTLNIPPRSGRFLSQCQDVQGDGCNGGLAAINAYARREAAGARATIRLYGFDNDRIMLFHPQKWRLNTMAWDRLGCDVAFLGSPEPVSQEGLLEDALAWLDDPGRPVIVSNFYYDDKDTVGSMPFYAAVKRDAVAAAGGHNVGIIGLWGPNVWKTVYDQKVIVPIIADRLRRRGAHIVVAFCLDKIAYWPAPVWLELVGLVDVIVPPACDGNCENNAQMDFINGTWVLPQVDSGRGPVRAARMAVIDFELDASGGLRPSGARDVDIMEPLSAAARSTAAYRSDAQWLQGALTAAATNDPPIGTSTAPMPDGRVRDAQGNEVDEVCRRDQCPLGQFYGSALMKNFPEFDVILINGGSLREGWPAGPITTSHIYGAMPFDNTLCSFSTTGPELWRLMDRYVAKVAADGSYNDSAEDRGGFPIVYGLRFDFDPSRPVGQTLLSLEAQNKETGEWEAVVRTRHYSIMMSTFLCDGGDGYDFVQLPGSRQDYATNPQTLMVDLIKELKVFTPPEFVPTAFPGDSRGSYRLPRLTVGDCTSLQRFVAEWEECEDCPEGMQRARLDAESCEQTPAAAADRTWIWILIAIGGVLVLVVPPVVWKFTANWRRMQRLYNSNVIAQSCAESIAAMRFEEVEYIRDISNPSALQKSFMQIIDTLKEYKTFLPEALFAEDDPEEDGEVGSEAVLSAEGSHLSVDDLHQVKSAEGKGAARSMLSAGASHGTEKGGAAKVQARSAAYVDKELTPKRVSVLWFGVSNFHADFDSSGGVPYHSKILDVLLAQLTTEKGVCDHMSGDRVVGTFGAAKVCGDQRNKAAVCAVQAVEECSAASISGVHVGFDCGPAKVGTLGGATLRKHSTIGSVMNVAYQSARFATLYQVRAVAGERIVDETHPRVQYHALCAAASAKLPCRGSFVFYEALRCKAAQGEDEWMYQLEEAEKGDPHVKFNGRMREEARKATAPQAAPPLDREQTMQRMEAGSWAPMEAVPIRTAF
eukprot:TRINITY_DN2700_c0_g1_i1.p1 TRINITY_DN2700_c0_g1~~TRINITY_DN2700_c0_g1_i1.p1  ORF type:complete len:1021 (+),score=310.88 TRINITY_DN2700_c0_g1_i1:94-3156(+)